jgi:hypothetical protein
MFDGSVMYGMLLWLEMSSSVFSRGSMIGPWEAPSWAMSKKVQVRGVRVVSDLPSGS